MNLKLIALSKDLLKARVAAESRTTQAAAAINEVIDRLTTTDTSPATWATCVEVTADEAPHETGIAYKVYRIEALDNLQGSAPVDEPAPGAPAPEVETA